MESPIMPERDLGPRVAAAPLTAPTQQLDRPAHDREFPLSAAGPSPEPRKRDTADGWPLRSYLQLGALPGAVPCARLHAKLVLWEWHLNQLVETSELLVSEIITNAVRASAGLADSQDAGQQVSGLPSVWLWLAADRRNVLIQVWDGNHETPTCRNVGVEAESGRGLMLVQRLSAQWGSYTPEGWSGKVVWALVTEEGAGEGHVSAEQRWAS
jgi:anti-sigma regulatory factor (Ser/Thr protein kinase)